MVAGDEKSGALFSHERFNERRESIFFGRHRTFFWKHVCVAVFQINRTHHQMEKEN